MSKLLTKKELLQITEQQKKEAEEQLVSNLKIIDYDTKEYPVEVLVAKYLNGLENDENELFIPDYQREFVWDIARQSKFIESILIGLPIPYFFVADVTEKEARLEVVDGSQRLRALAAFQNNELRLEKLEKLDKLNGLTFEDLTLARQRRFRGRSLRTIVLNEKADEEVRRDIFERINTGSDVLKDMEIRRGVKPGPFLDFITNCANNEKLLKLAPLSEASRKRREHEEFVLRYFAYADNYHGFQRSVRDFVNKYLSKKEKEFNPDSAKYDSNEVLRLTNEFESMLIFVEKSFPHGFAKPKKGTKGSYSRTPRIRFEAIAVGTTLALRQKPKLSVADTKWTESKDFMALTTSDASNSRPKVIKRIEFVKNKLLNISG